MPTCEKPECENEGRNRLFIHDRIVHICNQHYDEHLSEKETFQPDWTTEDGF